MLHYTLSVILLVPMHTYQESNYTTDRFHGHCPTFGDNVTFEASCGSRRCVSVEWYKLQNGCTNCDPDYEKECYKGACVPANETCCEDGMKECHNGRCIFRNESCYPPCLDRQVRCHDGSCAETHYNCPCTYPATARCLENGQCVSKFTQCPTMQVIIGTAFFGIFFFMIFLCCKACWASCCPTCAEWQRKYAPVRLLRLKLRREPKRGPVFQNVPSLFPAPIGCQAPEPIIRGYHQTYPDVPSAPPPADAQLPEYAEVS